VAYQTSTATSPNDLLGQLATFAAANGWTVTSGGTGGDPASNQRKFDDGAGGLFYTIPQNALFEIHFQLAASFNSMSTPFFDQTGSPNNLGTAGTFSKCGGIPNGSSFTYHFFLPNSAPRYIHCVIRHSSGNFTHFAFGTCAKFGTFVGGQYATGMAWRSTVATSLAWMFVDGITTSHATQWIRSDAAFSTTPATASITSADTGTNIATTSAPHGFATGTPVYLTSESIGGLDAVTNYFVRSQSSTSVSFHLTASAASTDSSRVDITSSGTGTINAPGWFQEIGLIPSNPLTTSTSSLMKSLFMGGLIDLTQRTPLCPNYLKAELTGAPGLTVFVGQTPDLRIISMQGRNPDGEIVTIGSDDWFLFPMRNMGAVPVTDDGAYVSSGTQPNHQSNLIGFAYRRIV